MPQRSTLLDMPDNGLEHCDVCRSFRLHHFHMDV